MKKTLLGVLCLVGAFSANSQQHNYLITSPDAESTFIRDAVVVNEESLFCALDLRVDGSRETAIAQFDINGDALWSKKINIEGAMETYTYDVFKHKNGSFYVHGLADVNYTQHAFVLTISSSGELENSTFFELGSSVFTGINKMEALENGDLMLSLMYPGGVSFVRIHPEGDVVWGKEISRETPGTGKQAGYDFHIFEDGGIVACGKNDGHFGLIKLSPTGSVVWDDSYAMGAYSQAKTIQVTPDGNILITGDYLRDGNYASFIMKMDGDNGSPIWAKELDQFDGSFHYQQSEIVDNEIHLSMMGNSDPSMMDPEFQNYYVRMNFEGEVIQGYRNGEKYDLADYQSLLRTKNGSIIFGSAFNEDREIGGLVHYYSSHEFDACYWTPLQITTSPIRRDADQSYGAYSVHGFGSSYALNVSLENISFEAEGTCHKVWDESTVNEEANALTGETLREEALVQSHEFTVFPNPNDGIFNIRTTYHYVDATIIDYSGKVILKSQMENGDQINLSQHPTGVYIMQIVTETETIIRRIQIR